MHEWPLLLVILHDGHLGICKTWTDYNNKETNEGKRLKSKIYKKQSTKLRLPHIDQNPRSPLYICIILVVCVSIEALVGRKRNGRKFKLARIFMLLQAIVVLTMWPEVKMGIGVLCVRVCHVQCICLVVTPKLAVLINLNRVIRFIEGCGRAVSHDLKCRNKFNLIFLTFHKK
jgi:hypothetical protein